MSFPIMAVAGAQKCSATIDQVHSIIDLSLFSCLLCSRFLTLSFFVLFLIDLLLSSVVLFNAPQYVILVQIIQITQTTDHPTSVSFYLLYIFWPFFLPSHYTDNLLSRTQDNSSLSQAFTHLVAWLLITLTALTPLPLDTRCASESKDACLGPQTGAPRRWSQTTNVVLLYDSLPLQTCSKVQFQDYGHNGDFRIFTLKFDKLPRGLLLYQIVSLFSL